MSSENAAEPLGARIALYSIAATGLASGAAQAEPVEPGGFPVSLTVETEGESGDNDSINFDVDGDGTFDFRLWAYGNAAGDRCSYGSPYSGGGLDDAGYGDYSNYIVNDDDSYYYASLVTEGTTIDETSNQRSYSYLDGCYYEDGNFPPPTRGYVGFSFYIGSDRHFGYFDIETAEGSLITTIHSACYESTPGLGIEVGACAPPPAAPPADDPGAVDPDAGAVGAGGPQAIPVGGLLPMSLGILALGATALHRRRQQR